MTALTIRPIRDDELPGFLEVSHREYVQQMIDLGGMDPEQARERGEKEFPQYFPDGRIRDTDAVFLLVDREDRNLGRLWVSRAQGKGAFIYDVEVAAELRGQGHGTHLLERAEEWAREQGLDSIGLHVFGGNEGAIALYRRLGYATTDLVMRKQL